LHATGSSGINLLHIAAQGDSQAAIAYLIEKKGFDVDHIDKNGMSALHQAARFGCELSVIYLISYKASIDLKDSAGLTPLLAAVKHVNEETGITTIKRLLLLGADRNATDKYNNGVKELVLQNLKNYESQSEISDDHLNELYKLQVILSEPYSI
jgi:ankyrin repeat protein